MEITIDAAFLGDALLPYCMNTVAHMTSADHFADNDQLLSRAWFLHKIIRRFDLDQGMANLKVVKKTVRKTVRAGDSKQLPQALQAYQAIEEMIVKGVLEPGAKVSEKGLSEMIGLGRTPIREALQRLAAEGMVTIVPRAGILIAAIDITDQFRLIEVRRELERLLAGRAARLASAEECDIFRTLAVRFREAGKAGDAELFIPTDREFNARIAGTANNKYALFAMSAIQAQTRRFWFLYFSRFGDLKKVCEFHAKMAEAIASADEASAKKASDNLIDYVEQYTRRTLDALCVG